MDSLFLYSVKREARKNKRAWWRAEKKIYRAFNDHEENEKLLEPLVCSGEFLDRSAVLVKEEYVGVARSFFKEPAIKEVYDVMELKVAEKTKL